jgi:hypothetical protein
MKRIFTSLTVTTLIFTIAILSSFLSHYFPDIKSFIWIIMTISFLYLFLGWWFFKAYYPDGKLIILLLMGYFYSCLFMAQTFCTADWPFTGTLLRASFLWLSGQLIILFILRKKIPPRGFIQFLIEAAIFLAITVFQISIF